MILRLRRRADGLFSPIFSSSRTFCVKGTCVYVYLQDVTSEGRDLVEPVPGVMAVVWSLHISRIPCYAGLITLASSGAHSTPIHVSHPPFFCLLFHPAYTVLVRVCARACVWMQPSCDSDPSFHLDQQHRGGGGVCFPLIGTSYWLAFSGVGPDSPVLSWWEEMQRWGEIPLWRIRE